MSKKETVESRKGYQFPMMRLFATGLEENFLQSGNTEPIGGGEDPDIDW